MYMPPQKYFQEPTQQLITEPVLLKSDFLIICFVYLLNAAFFMHMVILKEKVFNTFQKQDKQLIILLTFLKIGFQCIIYCASYTVLSHKADLHAEVAYLCLVVDPDFPYHMLILAPLK